MKKLSVFLLAMSLCLSSVLAGCGGSGGGDKTSGDVAQKPVEQTSQVQQGEQVSNEPHGTLRYTSSGAITTLNPHTYTATSDGSAIEQTSVKLYKFFPGEDGKYDFSGEAADGDPVDVNGDGTVYDIKIRQGMKWQDGEEINADDFIYSWKIGMDPSMVNSRGGTIAEDYVKIVNAKDYYTSVANGTDVKWEDVGIKKIDDYTIRVELKQRYSIDEVKTHFSGTWTSLVKEDLYEKYKEPDGLTTQYGTDLDKIACCGAFTIGSWNKGAEIIYDRNPDYIHSDLIHLEKLKVTVVKDASTRMQLFENGQIDFVGLSTNEFKRYEEDPRVLLSDAYGVDHLVVNCGSTDKPILGDPDFRRALYYAVDRQTMADMLYGIPAPWVISMKNVGNVATGERFRDMPESNAYLPENNGYDPEKAKEYFDKAMTTAGLDYLTVTLNYTDSSANGKMLSEFLASELGKIFGADRFELKLQGVPSNQSSDAMQGWRTNPNSFELGWGGWNTNPIAPWNGMKMWTTNYGKKNEPYSNAEYDELWEKANNGDERFDPELRLELTRRMEQILIDEAGIIPLMEVPGRTLKSDNLILPWEGGQIPQVGFGWIYSTYVD